MVGVGMGDQGRGTGRHGSIQASAARQYRPWGVCSITVGLSAFDQTVPAACIPKTTPIFANPGLGWGNANQLLPPQHFQFREAGVERFNDVYDDGYDED